MKLSHKLILTIAALSAIISATISMPVFADGENCAILLSAFCDGNIGGLLALIVNILTAGIVVAGTIGIIWAGRIILTARDNQAEVQKAKKRLFEIVLGFAVWTIAYVSMGFFIPGFYGSLDSPDITGLTFARTDSPSLEELSKKGPSKGGSTQPSPTPSDPSNPDITPSDPTPSSKAEQIAINAVSAAWPYQSGEHAGKCKNAAGKYVSWNKKKVFGDDTSYCGYGLKPENEAIYKAAYKKSSINDSYFKSHVQDCVYFLKAIIVYTGVDTKDNFPSSPKSQRSYLEKKSKGSNPTWQEIPNNGNTKNLQPGDVFANSTHVMIYVGKYGGSYGDMVGASARTWSARIHSAYFKNQKSGEKFKIFRYIK